MTRGGWLVTGLTGLVLGASILSASSSTPVVQQAQQLVSQPQTKPVEQAQVQLSNDNNYTNVDGKSVHSPTYAPSIPTGATAQCRDATYSFSQHRSGTCSHHGGVASWL